MALSEYESRILRDIEDSLHDVERRCAVIQRRMRGRRKRWWWLVILCGSTPAIGADLIVLGAITVHGGIVVARLGSTVLAIPCACLGLLRNQRLPQPAGLPAASPET